LGREEKSKAMKIRKMASDSLSQFSRLIPSDGLKVYPDVWYFDVNDIPPEVRLKTKIFFREDVSYKELYQRRTAINKGSRHGRRFCIYIKKDEENLGNIVFTEILDNPDGYGPGDFIYHKWIFPKFRGSKYSRYASADAMHMMFKSGVANRLYTYVPATNRLISGSFFDRVDRSLPCMSEIYPTDGPDLQKYIFVRKNFETPFGIYMLVEFNGRIYRQMDLFNYFMATHGRKEETVRLWLIEMGRAARRVWWTAFGCLTG
jgi:hypothetical protein